MSELVASLTLDGWAVGRSMFARAALLAAWLLICKMVLGTAATTGLVSKILTVGALETDHRDEVFIWAVGRSMAILMAAEALSQDFCLSGAIILAMSDLAAFVTDIQTGCLHLIDGILRLGHLNESVESTHFLVTKECYLVLEVVRLWLYMTVEDTLLVSH